MKTQYLKKIIPVAALVLAMGLNSCVGDLDTTPIDPSVTLEFQQDKVFYKLYTTLSLTGQQGVAGSGEVGGVDEGTSGFIRLIWNLNQLPTDEAICSWGDAGINELNSGTWSTNDGQVKGLYSRLFYNVTLANHFLQETEGLTDEKTKQQRAEARFMRALNYAYLLDFFGNVPFVDKVSSNVVPPRIERAALYKHLLEELKVCEQEMFAPQTAPYGRADVVANWLLQSRLYLNAEVYTGTADWTNAALYAKKVMDSPYELAEEYQHLFMADNSGSAMNHAKQEIILPIAVDGLQTSSYSTTFLFASFFKHDDMLPIGTSENWSGNRARKALIDKFFPENDAPTNSQDLSDQGDDRALFHSKGRTLDIANPADFKQGYSVRKYINVRADGGKVSHTQWPDTDVPFLRKAEAYLTFAEATLRNGGSRVDALAAINALRERANTSVWIDSDLTLDHILDEKSREFYCEGYRRTDLVRYGYFGGSKSGEYLWDWKGGAPQGRTIAASHNLYPIPSSDLSVNPNLTQNPGY